MGESRRSGTGASLAHLTNQAILQTLPRTVNTGVGAAFILTALAVLGGEALGDFALALLVGLVVGTYSSIFTAAPMAPRTGGTHLLAPFTQVICASCAILAFMTRRLAEVAKKVGVSEATVSRVLNNKPGVSQATRQAVLSALDVLGYERPTQLRGERARLVGLVLPELQNPIFPAFAEVIGGALAQLGLTPVLCTQTKGGVSEADYVTLLLQQQVSGVVFAGGLYAQADAPHDHYRLLADRNIPVVLVNAAIEHLGFPGVSCDDAVAVEQAWRHLASLGHERIGLVLGPGDHVPSARKLAAARAIAGGELPDEFVARAMFSIEGGHAATAKLIDRGVTGFVCASDPLALGAVRAARRKGLDVPSQISVVGYDDSALMNCTEPPLTTVRQPIESMGKAAVELLNARIGGSAVAADELLFEPELVVRGSTAQAPRP
ncbi:LacI family DNA-binding transcriptional regulator [Streptomyces sp. HUAS TT20]|uniref:LacI family DNA-binding transcriptional regulator n=1 Tax=Streptomyces sp. HUAS TT20 TaxID=3447509 RepID=UPI0039860967